ncbi:MAG: hypothetical protein K6F08_01690 [bacterium]|nr:hypothetical protein [bacterium]
MSGSIFSKEDHKLVVAIVAKGYSTEVIASAKSAGASGAVVLSGTGAGESSRSFFGLKITPENEVVMIVTKTKIALKVVEEIYKSVDYLSRARGLVFALPISCVTGMTHIKEENED